MESNENRFQFMTSCFECSRRGRTGLSSWEGTNLTVGMVYTCLCCKAFGRHTTKTARNFIDEMPPRDLLRFRAARAALYQ